MSGLTKEDAKAFLVDLIRRMNKQDNRGTATPYFYVVRRERWRIGHSEYSHGTTRRVWVDFNGDPTTFHSKEEFSKWCKDYYRDEPVDVEEKWAELTEFLEEQYDEDENVFFTEDAYKEHVRLNGHNLERGCTEYYCFLKHAFRNPELSAMFSAIGVLVDEQWVKK